MSDRSILRTLPALAAFAVLQLPPLLYVSTVHAGLTHEWPADGDALDAVGDADGTLSGGTTFGQGLFDEAFVFDGVDDEVSFGQTAGNFGNSDFTIAFVIRTTSTGVVEGVLGKRSVCAFGSFWDIRTRGHGDLSLEVYETDTNLGTTTTRPINDGLFHTVVFTREGTVMRSYVDGFLDQEIDRGTAANVSNDASLVAGTSACTAQDQTIHFTGTLDEIRLANTADKDLLPPFFHCGDANRNASITATDALDALQTAVGLETCDFCLCDANGSGGISAGDALLILKFAVAQPVARLCPICEVELPGVG